MPLVSGHYAPKSSEWLLAGQPSGLSRRNVARHEAGGNLAALATGVMLSVALPLQAGDVVSSLTFKSGATAASVPTHWFFALYDDSATPALIAQSADQATAAWAADTAKTLSLSSAYTVPRTAVYYASIMVTATTVPTLIGASIQADASAGITAADKILAQTSGSGLTATAPATIATPTTVGTVALVVAQ